MISYGKLSFKFSDKSEGVYFQLFYPNAAIFRENLEFRKGEVWEINYVKKGIYYLSVCNPYHDFSVTDLSYSFTPDPYTASVSLKLTIKKGSTVQLGSLVVQYENITPVERKIPVTWLSSAKTVASVSKTGKVKGLKKGTTTISATVHGGYNSEIKIVVTD